MPEVCPFCPLPPERLVDSDEHVLVVRDAFPVSPGHTLVLTRRHVASFFETTPTERTALLAALGRARDVLERELSPAGFNVGINDGAAAGQTVMHVHLHLIPRFDGDVDDPTGGVRGVIPGRRNYLSAAPDDG